MYKSEPIITKFLELAEQDGNMPWERPYKICKAVNYFSLKPYTGINSIMLPPGEYFTGNQINTYNKENNVNYRYQKGLKWYPVVFFKLDTKEVTEEEVQKANKGGAPISCTKEQTFLFSGYWSYYTENYKFYKFRRVHTVYRVMDRCFVRTEDGLELPSRFDNEELIITYTEPMEIVRDYMTRTGVQLETTVNSPSYSYRRDTVSMNQLHKSEDEYFCTLFHELAHSTGHPTRLNRTLGSRDKEIYAKEECIAELTASMLCSEANIGVFQTSHSKSFENSVAYFQYYKNQIENWGKEFITIVSHAEKAFRYIMNFQSSS